MLNTDLAALKTYMAENPGAVIETVARERNVTARAVLEALPSEMVTIGGGADAFDPRICLRRKPPKQWFAFGYSHAVTRHSSIGLRP